jgi:putative ABC transport system ATP-binding protein
VSTPVLSLEGVSKVYPLPGGQSFTALDGASLVVAPQRAVSITGRSGSGKSTLLHLAAGIDTPTAGRVSLLGRDLGSLGDRERTLARRDRRRPGSGRR